MALHTNIFSSSPPGDSYWLPTVLKQILYHGHCTISILTTHPLSVNIVNLCTHTSGGSNFSSKTITWKNLVYLNVVSLMCLKLAGTYLLFCIPSSYDMWLFTFCWVNIQNLLFSIWSRWISVYREFKEEKTNQNAIIYPQPIQKNCKKHTDY